MNYIKCLNTKTHQERSTYSTVPIVHGACRTRAMVSVIPFAVLKMAEWGA